jgi:serine/threonine protein phosphatase PrpC
VARARLGRSDVDGRQYTVTVAASVTALVFDSGRATVGQIGTARAYRCRSGGVEQLLRDQSLNPDARLPADARNAAYGLASARLGAGPTAAVLTRSVHVQAADRFVLVTDGVWTTDTDAHIAKACAGASAPEILAAIDLAAREATDDVTIAVAVVSTGR